MPRPARIDSRSTPYKLELNPNPNTKLHNVFVDADNSNTSMRLPQ